MVIISVCKKCSRFLFLTKDGYLKSPTPRLMNKHYSKHMNNCFEGMRLSWENFDYRVREFKLQ